jgi:hypothetical protein
MKYAILKLQLLLLKYDNSIFIFLRFILNPFFRINKVSYKLKKYGFKPVKIIEVSLDDLYACRTVKCEMIPVSDNSKIDFLENYFKVNNDSNDWKIKNIMQSEMFKLYLDKKIENFNIKNLSYYKWHEYLDLNGINKRKHQKIKFKINESILLLNDIKKKGFIDTKIKNLPIITSSPIINTRYKQPHKINGYEIQDGHHRVAALCSLGYKSVKAILVKDVALTTPFGVDLIKVNNQNEKQDNTYY